MTKDHISRFFSIFLILTPFVSATLFADNLGVEESMRIMKERLNSLPSTQKSKTSSYKLSDEQYQQLKSITQSDAFSNKQQEWRVKLDKSLKVKEHWGVDSAEKAINKLPYSSRPILFVSSSMPVSTLRRYIQDMEKVQGIMILRGFIGGVGKITPTLSFISNLTKKKQSCSNEPCDRYSTQIMIDPILFQSYGIQKVPAFALHGEDNMLGYCKGTDGLSVSDHVVYGDSSLHYLMQFLYKKTGNSELITLSNILKG